jgi:hypothetical protein
MLSEYCERGRANPLVLVEPDDELYASALPLPGARYYQIGRIPSSGAYGMDFASMGLVLGAAQYDDLDRWLPVFRRHLHEWGMESTEAIGTMIVAASVDELARNIRNHPTTDFFIPERYREAVAASAALDHEIVPMPPARFFLLARESHAAAPRKWSCEP